MALHSGLPTLSLAHHCALAAAALCGALVGCDDEPEVPDDLVAVEVVIDPSSASGHLHERYAGYAFDTAQISGGTWWRVDSLDRHVTPTPDLESPKLRRLASQLGPSLLRIGGTDCDSAYFCPEPGDCELPVAYRDLYETDDRLESVITHDDVRRIAQFAAATDSEVLFCINYGPGPRDPVTGAWSPDNARELVRFARSLPEGNLFTAWEPGNEINVAFYHLGFDYNLDARLFALDLALFRDVVADEAPSAIVPAPGSYILPFGESPLLTSRLMALVEERDPSLVDVLSWHLYATQSTACELQFIDATPENLLSEESNDLHRERAREIAAVAGGRPIWNTESASAQCGGQYGVSDSMADALWYMDWLGLMAEEGSELVIRHSLVGADYSLLEPETFHPRPTYLALVVMRRLVDRARLETVVDRLALKAHGYCSTGGDREIAAVLVNPSPEPAAVTVRTGDAQVVAGTRWLVSTDGDLASRTATLEGEGVLEDGTVPEPPGRSVDIENGAAVVRLGPYDLGFVRLELDQPAGACRE